MGKTAAPKSPVDAKDDDRHRINTKEVCRLLSCKRVTLNLLGKKHPRLFAPICRNVNGNIYHPKQVRIMARVMNCRMDPDIRSGVYRAGIPRRDDGKDRKRGCSSDGAGPEWASLVCIKRRPLPSGGRRLHEMELRIR
jgi:hypothetical protein